MKHDLFDLKNLEIQVKINEKGHMLAQVQLIYGDLLLLGFRVMESNYEDGLFVQPPSVHSSSGRFIWIVKIDNARKWNELKGMIKEAYQKAKRKYDENQNEEERFEDEKVDPKDLPF